MAAAQLKGIHCCQTETCAEADFLARKSPQVILEGAGVAAAQQHLGVDALVQCVL